jgi:hypothetical protein
MLTAILCAAAIQASSTITVSVLGEVSNPRNYILPAGSTVLKAVSMAGGPKLDTASLRMTTLRRKSSAETVPIDLARMYFKGKLEQNYALKDGDVLTIPPYPNRFITVQSGTNVVPLHFEVGLTLGEALRAAGWAPKSDKEPIRVERPTPFGPNLSDTYDFSSDTLIQGVDAPVNFLLSEGDIVHVAKGALRPPIPKKE